MPQSDRTVDNYTWIVWDLWEYCSRYVDMSVINELDSTIEDILDPVTFAIDQQIADEDL